MKDFKEEHKDNDSIREEAKETGLKTIDDAIKFVARQSTLLYKTGIVDKSELDEHLKATFEKHAKRYEALELVFLMFEDMMELAKAKAEESIRAEKNNE